MLLSGLEGLVDAPPDGHRRHYDDEVAPVIAGVGELRHQRVVPKTSIRHVQVCLHIWHITQIQAVGGGAHGLAVKYIADCRSHLRMKGLVFALKFYIVSSAYHI